MNVRRLGSGPVNAREERLWWTTASAQPPVVSVVGDDLQILDHFLALREALPGTTGYAIVTAPPPTTHLDLPAGVEPGPYLSALPATTVVGTTRGRRVAITLGRDLDRDRHPEPKPDPSIFDGQPWIVATELSILGFEGSAVAVQVDDAGCCGSPPEHERTVWLVDPGVRAEGYTTELDLDDDDLTARLFGRAGLPPDAPPQQTGPWRPRGRAPALEARREAHPWDPVVLGPAGPAASVEVAVRGLAATPTSDGWAFAARDEARDPCDGPVWLEATVRPAEGPPRRVRTDARKVMCADPMGGGGLRVRVAWSATGRAGVLVLEGRLRMAHLEAAVIGLPIGGPGVEVVGGDGVAAAVDAVRASGLRVVHAGASAGEHPRIEVFYAPGYELDARVLGATLRAARVAPLDWAAAGDLVVATP